MPSKLLVPKFPAYFSLHSFFKHKSIEFLLTWIADNSFLCLPHPTNQTKPHPNLVNCEVTLVFFNFGKKYLYNIVAISKIP